MNQNLFGLLFAVAVVAPVTEELIFRGVIQDGLTVSYRTQTAVLASSILFGLVHGLPWLIDPQLLHRKMLLNVPYSSGVLRQMKTPFVSETKAVVRAPLLGEHNVETLTEFGYSPEEIASLKEEGIL